MKDKHKLKNKFKQNKVYTIEQIIGPPGWKDVFFHRKVPQSTQLEKQHPPTVDGSEILNHPPRHVCNLVKNGDIYHITGFLAEFQQYGGLWCGKVWLSR